MALSFILPSFSSTSSMIWASTFLACPVWMGRSINSAMPSRSMLLSASELIASPRWRRFEYLMVGRILPKKAGNTLYLSLRAWWIFQMPSTHR